MEFVGQTDFLSLIVRQVLRESTSLSLYTHTYTHICSLACAFSDLEYQGVIRVGVPYRL